MQELNVSSSVQDRTGILNARDLMEGWDSRRLRTDRLTDWTN
jgi:hypothetical protein